MLTLIVKATEYCNANCVYCAVRDKEQKKERMSMEMLRLLIERCREYLERDPSRRVTTTWHGGEPALMGTDFYRAVRELQGELLGDDAPRLGHAMQSNITLMDDEIVRSLKALGIQSVGTSYDPTPGIRGLGPTCDSAAYTREFFRGLEVLHRNQMGAGVIFVVTSLVVDRPVESMIFLGNLLGNRFRGHFRLNPLYLEGEASKDVNRGLGITPEQFGHFMGKAYEYWVPRRHLLSQVAPFSGLFRAVCGEPGMLSCEEAGVCGNTHLSISAVGEVFQCGRAMDNGALHYGNIKEKSFDELFEHPVKRALIGRSSTLRDGACKTCELWDYCHGGCPVDSFIYHQDWQHKTYFCRAKEVFLAEYVLPIHERMGRLGRRAPAGEVN
jgi:uncharacterized protein